MLDLIVCGGKVVNGSGSPWFRADVGMQDGRIAFIGRLDGEPCLRRIDADGLVVCPGFIDMHTHSDLQLLASPEWEVKIMQGVTLEVLGQDGLGLAPLSDVTRPALRAQLKAWNGDPPEVTWDWSSMTEYLDRFDRQVTPNVACLVPHSTVRAQVLGWDNRTPTDGELQTMQALVTQAMTDGAVGLSAGLSYAPGAYANDAELVALCRAIRPFGGYYAPHTRNYGMQAMEAYADSIEIGRRAAVPVHLTHAHLNFEVNRNRAAELLGLVERARASGVDVTLDAYPYLATSTHLHAFLPAWAQEGGKAATLRRLQHVEARARIQQELEIDGSSGFHNVPIEWGAIVIAGVQRVEYRDLVGQSMTAAALQHRTRPFELYCELLVGDELGASALAFTGDEANLRAILRHPTHMSGSDGLVVGDRPHPRAWGTFARYLATYVRELGLVRLEEMIRKMTSFPAQRLGFHDRGVLLPGAAADVVCFDPERVQDKATYEQPFAYPVGIPYVVINGVLVKDLDRHTGAHPGHALRKQRTR